MNAIFGDVNIQSISTVLISKFVSSLFLDVKNVKITAQTQDYTIFRGSQLGRFRSDSKRNDRISVLKKEIKQCI